MSNGLCVVIQSALLTYNKLYLGSKMKQQEQEQEIIGEEWARKNLKGSDTPFDMYASFLDKNIII